MGNNGLHQRRAHHVAKRGPDMSDRQQGPAGQLSRGPTLFGKSSRNDAPNLTPWPHGFP